MKLIHQMIPNKRLTSSKKGQAIKRFASQNQGLEYEGREDLLQGYVEGLWSAPTAERYWRKVIVTQMVIAREEEVARAFGINSPGG